MNNKVKAAQPTEIDISFIRVDISTFAEYIPSNGKIKLNIPMQNLGRNLFNEAALLELSRTFGDNKVDEMCEKMVQIIHKESLKIWAIEVLFAEGFPE